MASIVVRPGGVTVKTLKKVRIVVKPTKRKEKEKAKAS
jgi:hypothetical protein